MAAPMVVVAEGVIWTSPVCWKTALPVPAMVKRLGEVVVPTDKRVMVVVAKVKVPWTTKSPVVVTEPERVIPPVKVMLPEVSMANRVVAPCWRVKVDEVANCKVKSSAEAKRMSPEVAV